MVQSPDSIFPLRFLSKWKAVLLAVFFVLCFVSLGAHEYKLLHSPDQSPRTRVDTPNDEKINRLGECDAGAYLSVAKHWAETGSFDLLCKECVPPVWKPFTFWAPGVSFFIGLVLKLTHSDNVVPYFFAVVIVEALTGLAVLWTVSLMTLSLPALLLTVFFTAWCPPVQTFFYSAMLTCSEPLALLFLAWACLALTLGFRALWQKEFKLKSALLRFAIAGLLLGIASLVRDSYIQFATFISVAAIGLACIRDRGKIKVTVLLALVLFASAQAPRVPVKVWNKNRMGLSIVAFSSSWAIWRYGLWGDYSSFGPELRAYVEDSGLGVGAIIDPESAAVVRAAFASGSPSANKLSLKKFLKMLVKHPVDFLMFRARRIPVLWLGTRLWPFSTLDQISEWSLVFYLCFFVYLGTCIPRRIWPMEIVYLHPVFLVFVSILIHDEFRYSFPNWLMLRIIPGLLLADVLSWGKLKIESMNLTGVSAEARKGF